MKSLCQGAPSVFLAVREMAFAEVGVQHRLADAGGELAHVATGDVVPRISVAGATSAGLAGGMEGSWRPTRCGAFRPDAGGTVPGRRGPAELRQRSSGMSKSKFLPLPQSVLPLPEGPEGYRLQRAGERGYVVISGFTQAAFVVTGEGVILVDAPRRWTARSRPPSPRSPTST